MFKRSKKKPKKAKVVVVAKKVKPTSFLQLPDDVLLVLFATHLSLLEGLQLGSTCRRLYGLYRDSFSSRHSLVLYRNNLRFCGWHDDTTVAERQEMDYNSDDYEKSLPPQLPPPDYLQLEKYKFAVIGSLFARLPNLLRLEIRDVEETEPALFLFVAALNSVAWHSKLHTLKLHFIKKPDEYEFDDLDEEDSEEESTPTIMAPIEPQQLLLPSLKHLSLCLHEMTDEPIHTLVFKSPLLFLPLLPQLISFSLSAHDYVSKSIDFLREHIFSSSSNCPQLAAAVGTSAMQVDFASILTDDYSGWRAPDPIVPINSHISKESTDQKVLECITSFYISDCHQEPELKLRQMVNLRRVSIHLLEEEDRYKHPITFYPLLLKSLASLQHLEVVEVRRIADMYSNSRTNNADLFREYTGKDSDDETPESMPVLPSVRTLYLTVSSSSHEDPLDYLHLEHCFPGLKQISVHFLQSKCVYCGYNHKDDYWRTRETSQETVDRCHRCALRLVQGLLRCGGNGGIGASAWESALKVAKVVVTFYHQTITFDSLENIVAGKQN